MAPGRQSRAQRSRSTIANGISKSCNWKTTRQNRRPRGLANGGQTCYRNATLQPLLHLPKFMNWILQHNEPLRNWPCRPVPTPTNPASDPNQAPPPKYENDPAIVKLGDEGVGCVPCLLKSLIRGYWANDIRINAATGIPNHLPFDHACWHRLHQLSRRWFYRDPHGLYETLESAMNVNKTPAQKEAISRRAREGEMNGQHDADEYLRNILNGIENTYQRWDMNRNIMKRASQYDSLFTRTVKFTRTCERCGNHWDDFNNIDEIGFRIFPEPLGTPDSIPAAIARTMTESDDMPCRFCSDPEVEDDEEVKRPIITNYEIVAVPEYLLIHNNVQDAFGGKNQNPLDIPNTLDLTQYMVYGNEPNAMPVRYGLRHVVYHSGDTLQHGHYVASVTGMPALPFKTTGEQATKFFCDDSNVSDFTNESMPDLPDVGNVQTVNPVDFSDKAEGHFPAPFDFYMAWYERLPNGAEKAEKMKAASRTKGLATLPVMGDIARRIKSEPRNRRPRVY